ncbi:MAG: YHS domain protein [Bacteroidetes bacterium]|nr:YHS domain protein [Bacteroidota bacterium]MBS1540087.1 YHS domain protein [Bacteroidota bacterium]
MKRIVFLPLLLITCLAHGQTNEARIKNFNIQKNVAIEGYDPVSYFDNIPQEGNQKFHYTYKGVIYLFCNPTNLSKFKATPQNYEPAYGGWCAYAMGETGEKVKIDPETYKILEGKLYLFYHFWGNNTLTTWNKNEKQLKTQADKNWKKILP